MGVFYETIPPTLSEWILTQNLFFVASAPLSSTGHINVSPKGGKDFGLLDDRHFWYMDMSGSGSETIAHLHEPGNARVTVMFCAFTGGPKIVRLWGHGRVLERGTREYDGFVEANGVRCYNGTRSVIVVEVHQVGSSCGFSVPFYDFKEFRPTLLNHYDKLVAKWEKSGRVEDSLDHYWAYKNSSSIDGLPGMQRGVAAKKKYGVVPLEKMIGPWAPKRYQSGSGMAFRQVILVGVLSFVLGILAMLYFPALLESEWRTKLVEAADGINNTHIPALEGLSALWTTR